MPDMEKAMGKEPMGKNQQVYALRNKEKMENFLRKHHPARKDAPETIDLKELQAVWQACLNDLVYLCKVLDGELEKKPTPGIAAVIKALPRVIAELSQEFMNAKHKGERDEVRRKLKAALELGCLKLTTSDIMEKDSGNAHITLHHDPQFLINADMATNPGTLTTATPGVFVDTNVPQQLAPEQPEAEHERGRDEEPQGEVEQADVPQEEAIR